MLDVCMYLGVIIIGCVGFLALIGWITGPDDAELEHEKLQHKS